MKLKKFAAAVSAALMLAVFTAAPALAADEIEVNEDISVSGDYDWTRFADDHITLNVYNNGLYISDGSDDSVNVVSAFEDLTGIKVNYTTYDSNESLYAKLKSGGVSYDVIFPSDYMVGKMINEGMLAELDMDNIPNIAGVGETYLDRNFDPGNKYSVPYMWGTTGLIYNTTMVEEPPTKWADMWDVEYTNNVLMFNNSRDAYAIAAKVAGLSMNPQSVDEITAITEKLAQTLEVSVGDTLELFFPGDDDPVRVKITQIVYNSVSQGLYMESGTWESLRKGAFMPTAILLKGPTQACLSELDAMEEVDQLNWPVDQAQELTQMLDMLASIFAMITLIALALAFVICYNMGLMNFSERTREYATLKVLGYHQKEIRGLIIGKNNIVSLLGVLCGILPGIGLTGLVLRVCESEMMAYPSRPAALSVVLASVVTYVFSLLIQLLLTRKVRGIDMVEALKSVE